MKVSEIITGQVVRLLSGGARMTIEAQNGYNITCIWFDQHDMLQRSVFNIETLELVIPLMKS